VPLKHHTTVKTKTVNPPPHMHASSSSYDIFVALKHHTTVKTKTSRRSRSLWTSK